MNELERNLILHNYLLMPNIRKVLVQARDSGRILRPDEMDLSLKHCLKENYILNNSANGYMITNAGKNALALIEAYKQMPCAFD